MIRDATRADWPAILALNEDAVRFTGVMDAARLEHLAALACYLRVIEEEGGVVGFLLGFREGTDYDSPNYIWFNSRFDKFHYVDRIVVAPESRGRGLADHLYDDFEAFARANGAPCITCEVNVEPPNPVSLKFHARRGFHEVGRQPYGPDKIVSLLQHVL
jgi:uncharacterized protein